MDAKPLPLPLNSFTESARAKHEPSLQFVFINSSDGKRANPKSNYSPAIRSHLRKRTISERRQRNAAPKFHRQRQRQLLQRAFSLRPAETPSSEPDLASAALDLKRDEEITSEASINFKLTHSHLKDQFWTSRNFEEPKPEEWTYQIAARRAWPRRERPSRRELLTETQSTQRVTSQPHRRHDVGEYASQSRQVGTQTSVRTMLGEGTVDPFRSFPIDASLHEHWLIYYYTSVCCQAFPKERETGHSRLLTKFVPMCMTDKLAFKGLLFAAERHSRGMAGLIPHISLRALRLAGEICALLNEEISKPNLVVTDAMIATVINLCGVELQDGGQHSKFICHMSGLEQMVRLRGGLNNLGPDGFLKDLVIWRHQSGGEFVEPESYGTNANSRRIPVQTGVTSRRLKPSTRKFISPPLLSNDMIRILRSIRYLSLIQNQGSDTSAAPSRDTDFQAACFGIQQQLKAMKSALKTTTATLEHLCILSAHMYIDKMLLNAPIEQVFKSSITPQLQEAIMKTRRTAQELEDHKEILDWIVSISGMNVYIDESQRANVVDKFHIMVTRLEGLRI